MRALFNGKGCGLEERWGAREMLAWGNSDIQEGSWPIERPTRWFLKLCRSLAVVTPFAILM
jgi:hypothetical protein